MYKFFKQFKFFNKNNAIKNVLGTQSDLGDVIKLTFMDTKLLMQLEEDLIILIVNNNYIVNFPLILTFFNNKYNYTIDEFIILSFNLGMVSNNFINNPIILLEKAIALNDVFTKNTIKRLKTHLQEQKDNIAKRNLENYSIDQENIVKTIDENEIANNLIDEWLNKNKKD